jgi:hypothetical protein
MRVTVRRQSVVKHGQRRNNGRLRPKNKLAKRCFAEAFGTGSRSLPIRPATFRTNSQDGPGAFRSLKNCANRRSVLPTTHPEPRLSLLLTRFAVSVVEWPCLLIVLHNSQGRGSAAAPRGLIYRKRNEVAETVGATCTLGFEIPPDSE